MLRLVFASADRAAVRPCILLDKKHGFSLVLPATGAVWTLPLPTCPTPEVRIEPVHFFRKDKLFFQVRDFTSPFQQRSLQICDRRLQVREDARQFGYGKLVLCILDLVANVPKELHQVISSLEGGGSRGDHAHNVRHFGCPPLVCGIPASGFPSAGEIAGRPRQAHARFMPPTPVIVREEPSGKLHAPCSLGLHNIEFSTRPASEPRHTDLTWNWVSPTKSRRSTATIC